MSASHGHEGEHGHPQPAEYVKIAVILTIVTAIEVALYYIGDKFAYTTLAIIALSTAKFAVVVMWYMHLKFDHKLFSYLLVGGLCLAGLVLFSLLFLLPLLSHTVDL